MRLRLTSFWLWGALSLSAAAPSDRVTFATTDGQMYSDVTVTRVMGRKMEVMTPQGARVLRYSSLPRPIQERFFDPSLLYPPKIGDMLDFTTLNGRAYKGPLREVAPNGITIETVDGLDRVAYSNLPPELANTFEYDADDAARYEAALRAQRARVAAAQQAAEKQAEKKRAADQKAARSTTSRATPPPERALGEQGARNLGSPRLGGSGLGK